jgi:MFS family permease
VNSPIWQLGVLFAIQGAAIGAAMPAATAAVMDVLPRERAGSASALTNTARQVAVALSVAVLGSILAQFYRKSLNPSLAHLPAAVRSTASSSITSTQAVAQELGKAGQALLAPANTAYVDAMHVTTLIAAVLALFGGLVVLRWMPGKPKSQPDLGQPDLGQPDLAEDSMADVELALLSEETAVKEV